MSFTKRSVIRACIIGSILSAGIKIEKRRAGKLDKWTMGTGLVVQNNDPLTPSPELIDYRFF